MSNQNKRNFQIEVFKHRVVMDPKYSDGTGEILEHAIHEIYNHNASGLSFEELYRKFNGVHREIHSKKYPNSYVFIIDAGLKSGVIKVQVKDDNVLLINGGQKREKEKEGVKHVRMEEEGW